MAIIEILSRVTHRSLMNKTKHDLAYMVLDLMDASPSYWRTIESAPRQKIILLWAITSTDPPVMDGTTRLPNAS